MRVRLFSLAVALTLLPRLLSAQDEPQLTPRTTNPQKVAPNAVSSQQKLPQLTASDTPALHGDSPSEANGNQITVPSGTKIPLVLKQGITTKNARVGDPVYAQTSFPITMNDHIVIPPGTFVQGEIRRVQRPGRVKGRAELQMSFTSMIFPNGYTVYCRARSKARRAANTSGVKGKEGTIQGEAAKAKMPGPLSAPPFRAQALALSPAAKAAGIGRPAAARSGWPPFS